MNKITADDVVDALKIIGVAVPAYTIAAFLGTDSRSVATASRIPVNDGRITRRYRRIQKGGQVMGVYRFVRLKAKS